MAKKEKVKVKYLYTVELVSMFDRDAKRVTVGKFYSTPKDFEADFKSNYLNAELISKHEKKEFSYV